MSSNYGKFTVLLWNPDNTLTPIVGASVKLYDATNLVDLGITLTSGTDGVIPAGAVSVAVSTEIRFRIEDDSHGRAGWCYQTTVSGTASDGINLVLKPSSGQNILFWPMAVAPYYKAASVAPVRFDIYYRELPSAASAAIFVGSFVVGQKIEIPFNPASDKTVRVTQIPFNAFGIPAFRTLEDAEAHGAFEDFAMDRNSGTPVIAQFSTASTTTVKIKVSGFNQYLVGRRMIVATDADFTTPTVFYFDMREVSDKTAQTFTVPATVGTQDWWVKIAHSTNGFDANATWSTDSNVLMITFAGTGGGSGSPGGGDPTPPDEIPKAEIT